MTINAPDLIHPVTTPIDQSPYSVPPFSPPFAINKAEIASASSTTALRVVIIPCLPFCSQRVMENLQIYRVRIRNNAWLMTKPNYRIEQVIAIAQRMSVTAAAEAVLRHGSGLPRVPPVAVPKT